MQSNFLKCFKMSLKSLTLIRVAGILLTSNFMTMVNKT